MKFYEFNTNRFDYYALIGAKDLGAAIDFYTNTVCDIDNSEVPEETVKEKVKEKLMHICKEEEQEKEGLLWLEECCKTEEPFLVLLDCMLI